jgi:hypothetical protein
MTCAADRLAMLQRVYPFTGPSDRVAPLLPSLGPKIGLDLLTLIGSGKLLAGEIGKAAPNATTLYFPEDGSHLIVINGGLLNFLSATAQALFRDTNVYLGDGTMIGRSGNMDDVVTRLTELFRLWQTKKTDADAALPSQSLELPTPAGEGSNLLARMAALFVLSHELGHVRHARDAGDVATGKAAMTRDEEFAADAAGVRLLVGAVTDLGLQRIHYAGAVVTLRVLSVLQSLGHVFSGEHPSPLDRLAAVKRTVREFVAEPDSYFSLATIATSFDEQLETSAMKLQGRPGGAPLTVERIVCRVYAATIECCNGRVRPEVVEKMFLADVREAQPEILPEVANTTARLFAPGYANAGPLQPRLTQFFAGFRAALPEPARAVFENACKQPMEA